MTSKERQALRNALITEGFTRTSYTADVAATGVYEETWQEGKAPYSEDTTMVVIRWGPRDTSSDREVQAARKRAKALEAGR